MPALSTHFAAVRDGLIWRTPGNLGAYIVVNTKNDFVRFRYLHMNPKFMDDDGLITFGRQVSQGEIIGKVATWGDFENGTSYHLHFNMQVITKIGWVWVNPYMSLVLAYEKLIGGRGTEIKPGDPAPVIPDKPPVILNPPLQADAKAAEPKPADAKPAKEKPRKPRRHRRQAARQRRVAAYRLGNLTLCSSLSCGTTLARAAKHALKFSEEELQ